MGFQKIDSEFLKMIDKQSEDQSAVLGTQLLSWSKVLACGAHHHLRAVELVK